MEQPQLGRPEDGVVEAPQALLNPGPILDMNYAFAKTAMLVAAVRLRLFTHLAGSTLSAAALASQINTLPGPTERLLKGLSTLGLLEGDGDTYRLTPLASCFLVEAQPTYLGGDTLAMLDYLPAWLELAHTVQTGEPYRNVGALSEAEAFFAPRVRDVFPLVYPVATRLAAALDLQATDTSLQVLDVGAGSGAWSAAVAQRYPTALITAIDLPAVVEEGRRQVMEMGLSERYTWVAADMMTVTLPESAYDLVILAHVCRFIGERATRDLFAKLYATLRPGGVIVVADTFLNEDRAGPAFAITLDLSMLVNTVNGRTLSTRECMTWLCDSGYHHARCLDVAGPAPVLMARKGEST